MVRAGLTLIGAAHLLVSAAAEARAQEPERVPGGGGVQLAVYEAGNPDGPPIVFIHGFTGSHLSWEHQLRGPLAQEFRLIAFDLRGHGASDQPRDPAHYTDARPWADDIAAVIRARNLERPVLVGWSYGGYMMLDLLQTHGQEGIGGLVFVGTMEKSGTEEAFALLGAPALEIWPSLLGEDLRARIGATRALMRVMVEQPLPPAALETSLSTAMMVPPVVRQSMFNRTFDHSALLRTIRVPSLVIHGRQDRIIVPRAAEQMAAAIPGARLVLYEGVGHAPFLEAPDQFNRDLAEFVRAVHTSAR